MQWTPMFPLFSLTRRFLVLPLFEESAPYCFREHLWCLYYLGSNSSQQNRNKIKFVWICFHSIEFQKTRPSMGKRNTRLFIINKVIMCENRFRKSFVAVFEPTSQYKNRCYMFGLENGVINASINFWQFLKIPLQRGRSRQEVMDLQAKA